MRGTDGLFRGAEGGDLSADPTARACRDGALEGSNVSAVETMVADDRRRRASSRRR